MRAPKWILDWGPKDHLNRRILHEGSKAQDKGAFQKNHSFGRILTLMWSLAGVSSVGAALAQVVCYCGLPGPFSGTAGIDQIRH